MAVSHYFYSLIILIASLTMTWHLEAKANQKDPQKIALLFLTCGDLKQGDLWKKLLERAPEKYRVYIHSKEKIKDPYFADKVIKKRVSTSWERHLLAWQLLFREAVADPSNSHFVLLSESCVPLHDLNHLYDLLTSHSNSFVSYGRPWWPQSHRREVKELPAEHRWVGAEWVILNREHAEMVATDQFVIAACQRHINDAESYFPSLLSFYGKLPGAEVKNRVTTYANWQKNDGPHPYTFHEGSTREQKLLRQAKLDGYLFARKFSETFPTKVLMKLIKASP